MSAFVKKVLLVAGVSVVLLSCATKSDVYSEIDAGVSKGAFEDALAVINEKGQAAKKPIYPEKNLILYYLDKGIVEYYAGRYEESAADLEDAERLIQEAYTKSVSAEIGSYFVNDNTEDYPGEDYEDIYTNIFNALNFYHQGDVEGADG